MGFAQAFPPGRRAKGYGIRISPASDLKRWATRGADSPGGARCQPAQKVSRDGIRNSELWRGMVALAAYCVGRNGAPSVGGM